ncbi:hypothetical protein ERO13_D01G169132v2 [Gossypium hirsutum]|nr:hypothetical protein ERO13_D01G169132v2 [Gossypium hirsutum]TYH88900.1 hypothetical protein ES332_D01G220900v1 [Gossypium tomentosum]
MENLSGPRRSLAVYFTSALSNRGMIRDAQEDLQHMAQVTSQTRYVASWRSSSVLAYRTCME